MLNVTLRSRAVDDPAGLPFHARDVRRVVFEDDPDRERARRIEIYARAARRLSWQFGEDDPAWDRGPAPKPLICIDTGQRFPSTKAAARFLSLRVGRPIRRSAIRTAIVRGQRCGGLRFRYVDVDQAPALLAA